MWARLSCVFLPDVAIERAGRQTVDNRFEDFFPLFELAFHFSAQLLSFAGSQNQSFSRTQVILVSCLHLHIDAGSCCPSFSPLVGEVLFFPVDHPNR